MKNSRVNQVLLVLGSFYMCWWLFTTMAYPSEHEAMVGIMFSAAAVTSTALFCMFSNKLPSPFFKAVAYFVVTFWIGCFMVHQYEWNVLSFMLWIPILAAVIAGFAKLSVRWIEGFLLGFWVLTAFYFFVIPNVSTTMAFRISMSYYGTQYVLTHYWALGIMILAYGFINKAASVKQGSPAYAANEPAPVERLPRREERPIATEKKQTQQRMDDENIKKISKDM